MTFPVTSARPLAAATVAYPMGVWPDDDTRVLAAVNGGYRVLMKTVNRPVIAVGNAVSGCCHIWIDPGSGNTVHCGQ